MLRPDIRLEWFVSFLAVIDTGSFIGAAEATHRSQPRVSMHVASLEREAGLPLFNRRKRPVELTDAGAALAKHARSILGELESAEAAMAPRRGGARGVVTLGSHPSASAAFVPPVLEESAGANPEVKVVLLERSTLELDEALTSGEVDIYLRPMAPPPTVASVRSQPLWREPLMVVHPTDHPLTCLPEPLSIEDVCAHPLITIGRLEAPEAFGFESYKVFRERGFELDPVQATNQPQTLMALVRQGIGVGVTNGLATHISDTSALCVRKLEGGCGRRVAVYWDGSRPLTPAARQLFGRIVAAALPPGTEAVGDHAGPGD